MIKHIFSYPAEHYGSTDILIEGHEDYALEAGGNYLRGYYPDAEENEIHMLLNCKREPVSAGTILLKYQEKPEHVILVLTGVAELLSTNNKTHFQLSSGTLIGDLPVLFGLKSTGTFRAEGIFHTHAHDDHFAGLTTLARANHRIKYYSTALVRVSVTKKLSPLLSISENEFEKYFEVCDLVFDK